MKKPEPVHKGATCSVCGLDWDRHVQPPTIETCVELLKAELASRPLRLWSYPNVSQLIEYVPRPPRPPAPAPYNPYPNYPTTTVAITPHYRGLPLDG